MNRNSFEKLKFFYFLPFTRLFVSASTASAPIRHIPRRLALLLDLPRSAFACRTCAGRVQGAVSVLAVDAIQGLHQAGAGLGFHAAQVHVQLLGAGRLQVAP